MSKPGRGKAHVRYSKDASVVRLQTTEMADMIIRCGNVGKLTRICATVSESAFASAHPRKNPHAPFLVLGGFTDFILTSAFVNGHGAITGLANVAPVSPTTPFPCVLAG